MNGSDIVLAALQPLIHDKVLLCHVSPGLISPGLVIATTELQTPVTHAGEYLYGNSIIGFLNGQTLPVQVRVNRDDIAANQQALDALVGAPIGSSYTTVTSGFRESFSNDVYSVHVKESEDSWSLLFEGTLKQ